MSYLFVYFKKVTNFAARTDSVKEWQLPMAVVYWLAVVQKVVRN